ncbi:MAG TPA: hypothetical protein VGM11_11480 [Acidobacteriaceae bacterium]
MRPYWLYDLSSPVLCFLVLGVFVAICLAGLFLTRGRVRRLHGRDHSHNDIVGFYLAAIAVIDAITLGLVAVGTWETYTEVQLRVDHEAAALASIYRDASGYPEPLRERLQGDLQVYYHQVVYVAWPMQRRGIIADVSGVALQQFQKDFMTFEPTTEQQKILSAETYRAFNELTECRRNRIDSVTTELPGPLWLMVLAGALVGIASTWLFHTASFGIHVWLSVVFSILIALPIYIIVALDNPYRGQISVGPEPLERVHDQLMVANH